jgi:hypothetical protein
MNRLHDAPLKMSFVGKKATELDILLILASLVTRFYIFARAG